MAHGGGGSHDHSHEHGGHGSHVGHNVEAGELTGCGEDGRTRPPQAEINLAEVKANQRKLRRATTFVLIFFVAEIIGGIWSGSLAIISDAAHLLADVSGFILAILASEIAARPVSDTLTYGPVRAEVLSALFSTVTILVLSLLLVYSAVVRIVDFSKGAGGDIDGRLMSFIAFMGLLVNMALLGILGHDHAGHDHSHGHSHGGDDVGHEAKTKKLRLDEEDGRCAEGEGEKTSLVQSVSVNDGGATGRTEVLANAEADLLGGSCSVSGSGSGSNGEAREESKPAKVTNINMDAALLHAVTDLIQSVGVLVAGLLIWYNPRWKWADPIATLFFVALVMHSTRQLLQRAFNVLLEGVPDSVDYDRLRFRLSEIEGERICFVFHLVMLWMVAVFLFHLVTLWMIADYFP